MAATKQTQTQPKKTAAKTASKTKDQAPASAQPQDHSASIDITGGREPVTVKLVGVEYEAMPPKGIIALRFAKEAKKAKDDPEKLIEAIQDWLNMTFPAETSKDIEERLYDNDDDLDIVHVIRLIQSMTSMVTGNPTT